MEVSTTSGASTGPEKTEKKSHKGHTIKHHRGKNDDGADGPRAAAKGEGPHHSPAKTDDHADPRTGGKLSDGKPMPSAHAVGGQDATKVELSAQAKSASQSEKDLKQADILMDHLEDGKLDPKAAQLAADRVTELLKKYGKM